MFDPKFIPIATDDELTNISWSLNTLIENHYKRLNSDEMQAKVKKQKLFPLPTINPHTLELQKLVNDEIKNRVKEKQNG